MTECGERTGWREKEREDGMGRMMMMWCVCVGRCVQDSKLPTVFLLKKHYLDIVDDDWIMDALSDDGSVSVLANLRYRRRLLCLIFDWSCRH